MNSDSRIDSEHLVIASVLLMGWAIWTVWRHLILPVLVVVVSLLLTVTGWRPEPAPVLHFSAAALTLAAENRTVPAFDPVIDDMDFIVIPAIGPALHFPSSKLPQQFQASMDRLSSQA